MAQVVENLPSKREVLSSCHGTAKKSKVTILIMYF
jgi:hypothetical protein